MLDAADDALRRLLHVLERSGYDFVTPTPATHARVLARRRETAGEDLRDVLGWSLPFRPGAIDPKVEALLREAGALLETADGLKSAWRVSRLDGVLFLHSAYPTDGEDAVFFGPDSYRFANFIKAETTAGETARLLVDIGAGCGVGALVCARRVNARRVVLIDVNPTALRLARINAAAAGIAVETVEAEGLPQDLQAPDLVLANPPYMMDDGKRDYRDGGARQGAELSIRWAEEAVPRLAPAGRMLLYSGSAIVGGKDELKAGLCRIAESGLTYRELDPDIFGEELERPAYTAVERIAAVGAVLRKI